MIKKVLALALLSFYIAVTFGFTVNMHFCKGQLKHISIGYLAHDNNLRHACETEKDACCTNSDKVCALGHHADCCKDFQQIVHFDDNRILVSSYDLDLAPFSFLQFVLSDAPSNHDKYSCATFFEKRDHAESSPPKYIRFHQLILFS